MFLILFYSSLFPLSYSLHTASRRRCISLIVVCLPRHRKYLGNTDNIGNICWSRCSKISFHMGWAYSILLLVLLGAISNPESTPDSYFIMDCTL